MDHEVRTELSSIRSDLSRIQSDLSEIRLDLQDAGEAGLVLFVIGAVCALWAQNSKRNPWIWFFAGLIFNVITLLVMLVKNSNDKAKSNGSKIFKI